MLWRVLGAGIEMNAKCVITSRRGLQLTQSWLSIASDSDHPFSCVTQLLFCTPQALPCVVQISCKSRCFTVFKRRAVLL